MEHHFFEEAAFILLAPIVQLSNFQSTNKNICSLGGLLGQQQAVGDSVAIYMDPIWPGETMGRNRNVQCEVWE